MRDLSAERGAPDPSRAGEYSAFVCYARENAAFVERLRVALAQQGKHVWVDVEAIVAGTEWQARIDRAIAACTAFIFVVTPTSVRSVHCRDELESAAALQKRIFPVVREVAVDGVPEAIERQEQVDFSDDATFEASVQRLVAALDTDVEWHDEHTRLAGRARLWIESDADASFLLRGAELDDAEAWLAQQRGRWESATDDQLSLITQSRLAATVAQQRARRRIRATLLGLVTGILGLTVVAVIAVHQRDKSRANERDARSLALASTSASLRPVRPDVALLLALAAYRLRPRPTTRGTLISALRSAQSPGGVAILHGHARRVNSVAVSRDGRWIVTGGEDRTVRLWDARSAVQVASPLRRASAQVLAVAMSRDGRTIAAADGKRVFLWTRGSQGPGRVLTGHTDEVWDLALTPNGGVLASTGYDNTVRFWDTRTGAAIGRPVVTPSLNGLRTITFSPDGRLLAGGGDGESGVQLWSTRTHRQVGAAIPADPDWLDSLAFTPDGGRLLSLGASGKVRFWSVRTHREIGHPIHAVTETEETTIAVGGDGVLAVAGRTNGQIRLWDLRTRRPLGHALDAGSGATLDLAFSDAPTLVSAGSDSTVRTWDLRAASSVGAPLLLRGVVDVSDLAFAPDGKTLAVAATPTIFTSDADSAVPDAMVVRTSRAAVTAWDVPRRKEIAAVPTTQGANAVAFAGRSGLLAYATDQIRFWDLEHHRATGTSIAATSSVALSPDGRLVASLRSGNSALLWSTRTGAVGPTVVGDSRPDLNYGPHKFAFSPDGRTLAYSTDDDTVEFWSLAHRRRVGGPLRGHEGIIRDVAYTQDGRMLATAGSDRTVRLWDARTHREIGAPLEGHGDTVSSIAFSPDGQTLVSGSWDGTLRLWDVASGQQLSTPLTAHHERVNAVAFGDDDTFASAGQDGKVRVWSGLTWRDERDVVREVCRIVGRDLTAGELATYAAGLQVQRACS